MPTHDDDLEIPEITDFSGWEIGRYARKPGDGLDIRIDGAVEYSLRLVPSNKIVGRFPSTFDAWPAVLDELNRGIPARSLVLDWYGAKGAHGKVASGRVLAFVARSGIGTHDALEPMSAAGPTGRAPSALPGVVPHQTRGQDVPAVGTPARTRA
jgi:hypothetical protein